MPLVFDNSSQPVPNDETLARVLIADDCPFNICALQGLLEQFNLKSDSACNGLEAIQLVESRIENGKPVYDLVLMDYSMPLCNGLKTTECLRSLLKNRQLELKQPFIALLTAYSDRNYFKRAYEKGVDLCMVKPVFQRNMHQILSRANLLD